MTKTEYEHCVKVFDSLKDIDDSDPRADEYNDLYDKLVDYENENNIYTGRV